MWMGIDGGGSHVRVVIVDDDLRELASVQGEGVNPSSIGRDEAARRIQLTIRQTLAQAHLATVTGVGIGIAGASADHSAAWLRDIVTPLLPDAAIYPSSDVEIALVGGRGRLDGFVLVVGTGSIAYGLTRDGRSHRAGGWGYLLGDEGSGYWIGAQALRTVTQVGDLCLAENTDLPQRIMQSIGIQQPMALINWMYHTAKPADVAQLAETVLQVADEGDSLAGSIIEQAAEHLTRLAVHVQTTLQLDRDTITYAGGLLISDNRLSRAVTAMLELPAPPPIHHKPAIGAALLAKLKEARHAH